MKKIALIVALAFTSGTRTQAQTRVLVALPARQAIVVTRRPVVVARTPLAVKPLTRLVFRPVIVRPVTVRHVIIVRS